MQRQPSRKHTSNVKEKSVSKFRNIYASTPVGGKNALYTNIKIDTIASTKLSASTKFIGVPHSNGVGIGIFKNPNELNETVKIEGTPAYVLNHGRPIQDFLFTPFNPHILVSSTRSDAMIRIWQLPNDIPRSPTKSNTECPAWGTEVDVPTVFLAGHEKKIEWMSYHPICEDILSSSSGDGTLRIWSVEKLEDRIILSSAEEAGYITDACWDYFGRSLWTCTSKAQLSLYDPRSSIFPISTSSSGLIASKGAKVKWLHPDPLVLVSGFKSQQERYIQLYDTRNLGSFIQEILIDNSGIGLLHPSWDVSLPLLYLTSRGEPIRVLEMQSSSLQIVSTLKSDKPAAATEILSKAYCEPSNCEIARFIRLSTDGSIDLATIHVPRVNCDTIFQEDLYPPIPSHDPEISSQKWFENLCTHEIEPRMVPFQDAVSEILELKIHRESFRSSIKNDTLGDYDKRSSSLRPPTHNDSQQKITELRRRSYMGTDKKGHSKDNSSISTSRMSFQQISAIEIAVELEKRFWLGSTWERRHMLLRGDKLYLSEDEFKDSPLIEMRINQFKNFSRNEFGKSELGFQFEYSTQMFRAKTSMSTDMLTVIAHIETILGINQIENESCKSASSYSFMKESRPSPVATLKMEDAHSPGQSHNVLMGSLSFCKQQDGQSQWISKLVILNHDGFLKFYQDDVKAFTLGSTPDMTFSLSSAVAVHVSNINPNQFMIWTSSRNFIFQCSAVELAITWAQTIQRTLLEYQIVPAMEYMFDPVAEGLCLIRAEGVSANLRNELGSIISGITNGSKRIWVVLVNGAIYYSEPDKTFRILKMIPLRDGDELVVEQNQNTKSDAFAVTLKLSSASIVLHHQFLKETNYSSWFNGVDHYNRNKFDWLSMFGIASEQAFQDSLSRALSSDFGIEFDGTNSNVFFYDEQRFSKLVSTVKNNNESKTLKILYAVQGQRGHLTTNIVKPNHMSLREDMSFVLDLGSIIYHWHGPKSSRIAQAQALNIASEIRKSRSDRPRVLLVEPDEPELLKAFATKLGTTPNDLTSSFNMQENLNVFSPERTSIAQISEDSIYIFKVKQSAILRRRLELVFKGPQQKASKKILDSKHAYILYDIAGSEVFAWIGKNATEQDESLATYLSHHLVRNLAMKKEFVCIGIVLEDLVPVIFKAKFADFESSLPIQVKMEESPGNIARVIVQHPIDVASLVCPPTSKSDDQPLHDGNGTIELFRVNGFTTERINSGYGDKSQFGAFSCAESYILLFKYRPPLSGVDKCISYFWQGSQSTITEKGTSALLTIEMTSGLKDMGDITQVRVTEGKEPVEWFSMFPSGLIILLESITLSMSPLSELFGDKPIVFDIRCLKNRARAVQLRYPQENIVFNSCHVLLVLSNSCTLIWKGKFSTSQELEFACSISKTLAPDNAVNVVDEVKSDLTCENDGRRLWKDLNLPKIPNRPTSLKRYDARLFLCSGAIGAVQVNEVNNFVQEDLDPNCVFILDANEFIFVWFGSNSKPNEKIIGMETAKEYIRLSTKHDPKRTILAVTFTYQEPIEFTRSFQGWTRDKFPKDQRTMNWIKSLEVPRVRPLDDVLREYKRETFTIQELQTSPPEFLDKTKLEMYLSKSDFEAVFGMSKEEYMNVQPWKRDKLRKQAGFF